jgi:hypothetical protein
VLLLLRLNPARCVAVAQPSRKTPKSQAQPCARARAILLRNTLAPRFVVANRRTVSMIPHTILYCTASSLLAKKNPTFSQLNGRGPSSVRRASLTISIIATAVLWFPTGSSVGDVLLTDRCLQLPPSRMWLTQEYIKAFRYPGGRVNITCTL